MVAKNYKYIDYRCLRLCSRLKRVVKGKHWEKTDSIIHKCLKYDTYSHSSVYYDIIISMRNKIRLFKK